MSNHDTTYKYRTCNNSIFDPILGEYKCAARNGVTIYHPAVCTACERYIVRKGEQKVSKVEYDYEKGGEKD